MFHHSKFLTSILFGACCFTSAAFADIIPSPTNFEVSESGTGFGNVSTLITLQTANGQTNLEAGCIGFNNSTTDCGIAQDGKIKNSSTTEPVPTGITASDLRFVFNASQPQGGSIDLTRLEVSFYGDSSTPLYTASLASPILLTSTLPGVGNSGFVFELSPSEAQAAQGILGSTTSIGAGFSATGASGGQDTLFLATVPSTSSVPEPKSYGFLIAAVTGFCLVLRRRKTQTA
jgi:hypothetical protein